MKKELEIFKTRYSCRNYKNEKLKAEDLNTILEIARLSPSSLGLEPWKFIVVQDSMKKEEIAKIANNQNHVKNCAALIIIVSRLDFLDYFEDKLRKRDMSEVEIQKRLDTYLLFLKSLNDEQKISYSREQAHIALAGILYSANALNIASCTIGGFDKERLDAYLLLDTKKEKSTLIVALGYSDDKKIPQKTRFDFDDVIKFL